MTKNKPWKTLGTKFKKKTHALCVVIKRKKEKEVAFVLQLLKDKIHSNNVSLSGP